MPYRADFDKNWPAIKEAIDTLPDNLGEFIPGLSHSILQRFFQRFSILFGRLDKSGARHPTLLAYSGGNVADHIVNSVDDIINALRAGPDTFFSNWMPRLATQQLQLERALGRQPDEFKELSVEGAEDLRAAMQRATDILDQMRKLLSHVKDASNEARISQSETRKAASSAAASLSEIQALKDRVDLLASSDGRRKDSFEYLVRIVQDKANTAKQVVEEIVARQQEAHDSAIASQAAKAMTEEAQKRVSDIEERAQKVLNLSTQAGLATSYINESGALKKRSDIFTVILYVSAVVAAAAAGLYVIPSLEHALTSRGSPGQAIPIAILRASILAPFVYIIYFTTRQISGLETLRMDYAEKAAASLAYSGYRDEMSTDDALLERLRASLLLRFAEHPERLLRKKPSQESVEVQAPGFKAVTRTSDYPGNSGQEAKDN